MVSGGWVGPGTRAGTVSPPPTHTNLRGADCWADVAAAATVFAEA